MKILDKDYKELKPDPFICSILVSDGEVLKTNGERTNQLIDDPGKTGSLPGEK